MKKIIFLDIDGVLNSNAYFATELYKQATDGMSDAHVMLVAHNNHLDPYAIELVNKLVERTGAEVVMSSTWRIKYKPEEMTEMLAGRGARFKIAASTPVLYGKLSERIPRGKEIAAYLKSLSEQPESFVILDDNADMLSLGKFLVRTDYKLGLTPEGVEMAVKILNGEIK